MLQKTMIYADKEKSISQKKETILTEYQRLIDTMLLKVALCIGNRRIKQTTINKSSVYAEKYPWKMGMVLNNIKRMQTKKRIIFIGFFWFCEVIEVCMFSPIN